MFKAFLNNELNIFFKLSFKITKKQLDDFGVNKG